ncbi:hypothetical protein [Roseateles sp.]|uniref:hypothetical protein n=1 Tax=Roseateles sp. TaxID=1971397 RepID=UPI003BA8AB66
MNTTTLIQAAAVAAFAFTTFAANAAAHDVVKLPRVVVTGKAATQVNQLPRVVVTGYAIRDVAQLPRVVVNGLSEATLLRQQNLATAATAARRV